VNGAGGLRDQLRAQAMWYATQRPSRATQPYRQRRIPGVQPPPAQRPPTMAFEAMRAGRPFAMPHPMDVRRGLQRQARRRA
jgi:hypothetical protein